MSTFTIRFDLWNNSDFTYVYFHNQDDDNSTNCVIFNGEDNLQSSRNSSDLETDRVPVISSDSKEKIQ